MSDVAFFLDLEHLLRGREDGATSFSLERLLSQISRFGRLVQRRAYGDWSDARLRNYRIEILEHGFELPQSLQSGKGLEVKIVVDALGSLYLHKHITTFVFAGVSPEYLPLFQKLREHGKQIVCISPISATTPALRAMTDALLPLSTESWEPHRENHFEAEERKISAPREPVPVPVGPHRRIRLHGTAIPLFNAEVRKNVIDGLYEAFSKSDGVDVRAAITEVAQKAENQSYDQYIVERIQQTLYYAHAFLLRGGMHDAILAPEISSADDLHRRYDRHLALLLAKEYPALDATAIAELLCEDEKQALYIAELLSEEDKESKIAEAH